MEYITLTAWFVREVLAACEGWEGKDAMPMKLQELMMVLQIEADSRRYKNTSPAPQPKVQNPVNP